MAEHINRAGGPAFPVSIPGCGDNGWHGMSLRDWFAGQAINCIDPVGISDRELTRLFGRERVNISGAEIVAALAYEVADAMLAERAKSGGDNG